MKLHEVVILLEKKLTNLSTIRQMAYSSGDIDRVLSLDEEILDTEATLHVIKSQLSQ